MGLLEQPVIIASGKREKRKVERLSMTEAYNTPPQPKELDIPEGVGTKLGDIPRGKYSTYLCIMSMVTIMLLMFIN